MPLAEIISTEVSGNVVKFDEAALQTAEELSRRLIELPLKIKEAAYEIRIRCGQPMAVTSRNGTYIVPGTPVSRRQMKDTFARICGNAIYSHQTEIADGCITLVGGHRAGICGRAVRNGGNTLCVTDVSSVCIRIAHEVIGCAGALTSLFTKCSGGILIAGPPCSGKTTVLRDMARTLAMHHNVSIVDERNEIAAVYKGVAQLDIGQRSDVLIGQNKAAAMLHAVRCMSPEIMICDEIGSADEAAAVREAVGAGVRIIAAMHCGTISELSGREQFRQMKQSGAFAAAAVLSRHSPGEIIQIANINEI